VRYHPASAVILTSSRDIQEMREGTTDSAVNIPLLNLPLTLSAFSRVGWVLNVVLLLWLSWHVQRMGAALKCYRACAPEGQSRMEAALWGLPGLGRWRLPIRLAVAFCLSAPSLLGTCILLILWWTDSDQGIPPPPRLLFSPQSFSYLRLSSSTKSNASNPEP
jgi:hypothetical protein